MPIKRTKQDQQSDTPPAFATAENQMAAKQAEIARKQPTIGELSHLAAAFVAGHGSRVPEAVRQAMSLWKTRKDALKADIEDAANAVAAEAVRAQTPKVPMPDKLPVPLDKFLRLLDRRKYAYQRLDDSRRYLAEAYNAEERIAA